MWDFEGIYASSKQIPGVRFPGLIHPGMMQECHSFLFSLNLLGVIGTAPSQELLDIWNARERGLAEAGPDSVTLGSVLHTRPLAAIPDPKGALLGLITKDSEEWEQISREAGRTIPGRENGGNCDIKFLSRGSKIYLPVFVEGKLLNYCCSKQ